MPLEPERGPALLRVAVHNQGDAATSPVRGWDVQCLTERSKAGPPPWAERYAPRIKGLAIDWNPEVLDVKTRRSFLVHPGAAKITPGRGTAWVTGRLVENGARVAVVCSHRINDPAATKRTGGAFRRLVWAAHAAFDRALFKRLERRGHVVLYGGDINHRAAGLAPLRRLLMGHYDALAHSTGVRFVKVDKSPGRPSDHARYTATYEIP